MSLHNYRGASFEDKGGGMLKPPEGHHFSIHDRNGDGSGYQHTWPSMADQPCVKTDSLTTGWILQGRKITVEVT